MVLRSRAQGAPLKMIGEIRQNFSEASASVGLILATALKRYADDGIILFSIRDSASILSELRNIVFFYQVISLLILF